MKLHPHTPQLLPLTPHDLVALGAHPYTAVLLDQAMEVGLRLEEVPACLASAHAPEDSEAKAPNGEPWHYPPRVMERAAAKVHRAQTPGWTLGNVVPSSLGNRPDCSFWELV